MSIVFTFTGNVTINVSGATTIALPGILAEDPPAFVAVGEGSGGASPATSHSEPESEDKSQLLTLLNDPNYRFRKISTLADSIGRDESDTEDLLRELGARQEDSNDELWGLKSRVGESKRGSY